MAINNDKAILGAGNIWVISKGRYTNPDLSHIVKGVNAGPIKEYRISELAQYMLNPNPIEVQKKLVGCEIYHNRPFFEKLSEKIREILPKGLRGTAIDKEIRPEVLISECQLNTPPLKDENLELHLKKAEELLRSYDPILKRLSKLDGSKISDIVAICGEIDKNRSWLKLQGNIDEKINYIFNAIFQDISVVLEKAHISDGLFELGGFDFQSFDPNTSYRLIKFTLDGKPKCCVLDPNNTVQYWIENIDVFHYLHLFEQSIQTNSKLQDSLDQCMEGKATPLKLFFNKQLEIDYSRENPPAIYKEVFEACNMRENERDAVINSLSSLQILISFNYAPQSNSGKEKLFTSISVMHDIRALESVKDNLPQLYSEITKRASLSEAGRFYLLDSIRGYVNE